MRVAPWLAMALVACGRFSADTNGAPPAPDSTTVRDAGAQDAASPPPVDLKPDAATCDFCEDWEGAPGASWTETSNAGTAGRSMAHAHSGQWALESRTDATDSIAPSARAIFTHHIDTTKRKGRLSAWVWIDDWQGNTPLTVFELGFVPADSTRVSVQLTGDASVDDFKFKLVTSHGTTHSSDQKLGASRKVWTKVTLDFDVNASKMTLTRGEPPDADSFDETTVTYGNAFEISGYDLRFGLVILAASPTAKLYIDDVSLSLE